MPAFPDTGATIYLTAQPIGLTTIQTPWGKVGKVSTHRTVLLLLTTTSDRAQFSTMKSLSKISETKATYLVETGLLTIAERVRYKDEIEVPDLDLLATEEPLEIRLGGAPIAVVMRTPGNDAELALGFVLGEGIIKRADQIERISHCSEGEHGDNVISLIPAPSFEISPRSVQRDLYLTSSCGVCGKGSMDQVFAACPVNAHRQTFAPEILLSASAKLKQKQEAFAHCGALHGVGLMDTAGEILCVREDIGRHNAVDKVVGWGAQSGILLRELVLVVSGRCSFEIIQKALMARISCVVAVGGVSSLAADLAKKGGVTLAGFARDDRLSFYSTTGMHK